MSKSFRKPPSVLGAGGHECYVITKFNGIEFCVPAEYTFERVLKDGSRSFIWIKGETPAKFHNEAIYHEYCVLKAALEDFSGPPVLIREDFSSLVRVNDEIGEQHFFYLILPRPPRPEADFSFGYLPRLEESTLPDIEEIDSVDSDHSILPIGESVEA